MLCKSVHPSKSVHDQFLFRGGPYYKPTTLCFFSTVLLIQVFVTKSLTTESHGQTRNITLGILAILTKFFLKLTLMNSLFITRFVDFSFRAFPCRSVVYLVAAKSCAGLVSGLRLLTTLHQAKLS
jgi:hypothetical protein